MDVLRTIGKVIGWSIVGIGILLIILFLLFLFSLGHAGTHHQQIYYFYG